MKERNSEDITLKHSRYIFCFLLEHLTYIVAHRCFDMWHKSLWHVVSLSQKNQLATEKDKFHQYLFGIPILGFFLFLRLGPKSSFYLGLWHLMQPTLAQLRENILQRICINELASRPSLFLHSQSSYFCSLSLIFSKSLSFCQTQSKRLARLKASLRRSKKCGKVKAKPSGVLKTWEETWRIWKERWRRIPAGCGKAKRARETNSFSSGGTFKKSFSFILTEIHEQSEWVGMPVLCGGNTREKWQLWCQYEHSNAAPETLAPVETLLGAHLQIAA